ncbi:Translation elongation factor 1 beta [Actinomortierella ambigua]|uniref:Translation elongation factor 1 beta n=1 Tax=Actinomortierella ambigua TaxID=1343610 RepID=A0A9P6QKT1_9FUNG|nr:Translation elongation factor 1 beta [Actinomortierella ambigua]KAG0268080.1 Translation elongation factor 1 beta [Actinomortierella ambigua]
MSVSFAAPLAWTLLNSLFEARSYVAGYEATDKDVELFKALSEGPNEAAYPHAARWYKHISAVKGLEAKAGAAAAAAPAEDDDEDVDLFGSDDEVDEEAEKLKAQRLAEYHAKKALKPKVIAKTTVTLDIKPWDDETDMDLLVNHVRGIEMDGLVWGGGKLVAVGYGIKKYQVNIVIEDDKVNMDDVENAVVEDGAEYIQSMDIVAMQKI